jgi:competence protein ComEC
MIKRPLIPVVICYCLGLIAPSCFTLPLKNIILFFSGALICYIAAFYKRKRVAATCISFPVFFLLGLLFIYPYTTPEFNDSHLVNYTGNKRVNIEGVIDSNPVMTRKGVKLYLKDLFLHDLEGSYSLSGRLMLSIKEPEKVYSYGDRVRFFCYLRKPSNFNNPGSFDYVRYLSFKNVFVTAFLRDDSGVTKTGEGFGNLFLLKADSYRIRIRSLIDDAVPSPAGDVLRALILGDKGMLPHEIREQFIKLGIAHLLAISGLHVGIVAFVSYLFFNLLFRVYHKVLLYVDIFKCSVFLSIFPVLFYCLIAGFQLPTLRAALMVLLYMVSLLIGRKQDILSTLFAAGLVILILMPTSIYEVSFQLSFSAVFFIIILVPAMKEMFKKNEDDLFPEKRSWIKTNFLNWVGGSSAATAAAILGTVPLIIIFFHRFSLSGFISNLLIVPFVGFTIIPVGLMATILLPVSCSFSVFLFKWAGALIDILLKFTKVWSDLCSWEILVSIPALWEICCYYALLMLFPFFVKRKKIIVFFVIAAVFVLIELAAGFYNDNRSGLLKVTFLDVGNGDAALVEFPKGKVMLIDGGGFRDGSFDVGKEIIAPVLHKKKIKKVDYAVLSHPHMDHMGGLPYIIENFKVDEFWYNGEKSFLALYGRLMRAVEENNVEIKICSNVFPVMVIDGVQLEIISPFEKNDLFSSGSYEDVNNNSLVIRLIFGTVSFLFTGDILSDREKILEDKVPNLFSNILKIPHHGSSGSSEENFARKVSPDFAIVSCRLFGEKTELAENILNIYKELGSKVIRTDLRGAVEIETDGTEYSVNCLKN